MAINMTKWILLLILLQETVPTLAYSQNKDNRTHEIQKLIDDYSRARDKKDTILLKSILTDDIDQLVSTGEWRNGLSEAIQGMQRSSQNSPGERSLIVEKVRFLDPNNAIADARYEIKNPDGSIRKMWSTFFALRQKNQWKITAIRNMLPSTQ